MEEKSRFSSRLSDAVVLVGGQPRSGTSLLTSILNSGDDLVQAYELHVRKPSFLVGLDGRYTENIFEELGLPRSTFQEIVRQALSDKVAKRTMALGSWAGPPDPISAEISYSQSPANLRFALPARLRLVKELMGALAEHHGKPRWGFKILTDSRFAEVYFEAFSGSKLLFLLRDPRDHAVSVLALNEQRALKNQRPFYHDEIGVARDWVKSIREAESLTRVFGDRVTILKYEDLVSRPEDNVRVLSEKLSLDLSRWGDAHLRADTAKHAKRFTHHFNLTKPIQAASVGRWRRELTPQQAHNILEVAGTEMNRYGYE